MVTPREGTENNTTVTNLSGGERSYSSFAFLHALWQCLGFPFCILDEFDVFMVNFYIILIRAVFQIITVWTFCFFI